ncbi:streptophobe family protein [Streptomyces cucumeris]|uniref:streptophobe family protein n=1 Tax=Streptomyces cucumeris TaxID=2962890 RepID=UPI0020C915F8|nr:streptophobe family protein [Streptomyces sp. NEAU-Y11]MCP9211861.1 streptophobe family protein [Streptomyces sp. NEAU-Y11]
MSTASQSAAARPGGTARHALEGALAVLVAGAVMAATAYLALLALGAGDLAPVSRLTWAVTSMAVGSGITLGSGSPVPLGDGGGRLGGLTDGLSVEMAGEAAAIPLGLTVLGAVVLGYGFFRPLRSRPRPAPALLVARLCGALGTAAVLFPSLAMLARGTLRLPDGVTDELGDGSGRRALLRFGDGGTSALRSMRFEADPAMAGLLGVLGVAVLLGVGCVAARRTTLPTPLAMSRLRLKWHPVASALSGVVTTLCVLPLAVGALAGGAALAGWDRAARAAGSLLLAGPNLSAVALTSGLGSSWEAAVHRQQGELGGLLGTIGQGAPSDGGRTDRTAAVADRAVAGVPLWLIGLLVLVAALVLTGRLAAARTPARTAREEANAPLSRHLEIALRTGFAVCAAAMLLALASGASFRIGVSVMGRELRGVTGGLDGAVGLAGLSGLVLAGLAAYWGSRLHGTRTARPGPARPDAPARPVAARASGHRPRGSADSAS